MKKKIALLCLAAGSVLMSGCATTVPVGGLVTSVSLPVSATSNSGGNKEGTATCNSYLRMVAVGDCTVEAAMKNGGISKVTHMDWKVNNILGIFGTYTLTVYGN